MNTKNTVIPRLLALGLLFFALMSQLQAQPDTVVVHFGKKSHFDLHLVEREDMKALKKLEMNQLIRDIEKYLENADSLRQKATATDSQEDEVIIRIRNLSINESRDDKVYVRINEQEDCSEEEEDKAFVLDIDFDLGLNTYFENGGVPNRTPYDLRVWGSRYIASQVVFRFRLNKKEVRTPVSLKAGIGFSTYNFMFEKDVIASRQDGEIAFVTTDQDLDKTKLEVSYLYAPITLQIGDKDKSLFTFGVGGYFGVRTGARTRVVYQENEKRVRDRVNDHFHLQDFRYGLRTELGIGRKSGVTLFANYDLNDVFRANRGPELRGFSFGVTL